MLAELVAEAARRRALHGPGLTTQERKAVELLLTAATAWRVPTGTEPHSVTRSDVTHTDTELRSWTWLDTRTAASRLGITTRALVAAVHRGKIPARRTGRGRGTWRIAEDAVEAYASRRDN